MFLKPLDKLLTLSILTRPDLPGYLDTTFFRVVVLNEKSRERKKTKRRAFCSHLFLLFIYSVYYAWSYIESSCQNEHKVLFSRSPEMFCAYRSFFPSTPYLYNGSSWINLTVSGWPPISWVPLNEDALRPNSLSFHIALLLYAFAMGEIFFYDDVYHPTLLPRAEFVRTHYPAQFEIARQAMIKHR